MLRGDWGDGMSPQLEGPLLVAVGEGERGRGIGGVARPGL
jgi:hypothetical protein